MSPSRSPRRALGTTRRHLRPSTVPAARKEPIVSGTTDSEPTYLFGPRDRRTLLLGLRLSQILLLAMGAATMLTGLLRGGSVWTALGVSALVISAMLAFLPVQERPLVDWLRPVLNHAYGRITGQATYLGGPWALHAPTGGLRQLRLPGIAARCLVRCFDVGRGEVAIIRQGSRWTAVLQVTAPAFPLADRGTQEGRVQAWGSLLAQLGQEGSRIASFQWLERTIPDTGKGLTDWWSRHGDPDAPSARSYEQLIANAGPAATKHETFVAVTIDERRARRAIRSSGGGPDGTARVLAQELAWVESGLQRSDVEVQAWLGAAELGRLIRTQYDPQASHHIDRRGADGLGTGVHLRAAGPMAARAEFSHYRTDSGFHAVYWVASWPRMQVQAAWLYPLLVLGGVRRTISVTAEPVPQSKSFREVRSAKVQKLTDEAQRDRFGQVDSALDHEEHQSLLRRERELVQGHVEYRFTGYVTVSAVTRSELEDACAQVEQAAVRSVLEVRRIYGEQDQAFAVAALPLGRGSDERPALAAAHYAARATHRSATTLGAREASESRCKTTRRLPRDPCGPSPLATEAPQGTPWDLTLRLRGASCERRPCPSSHAAPGPPRHHGQPAGPVPVRRGDRSRVRGMLRRTRDRIGRLLRL
ncbi:SCO6880 family protein [Nocardioides iriomotensis]|uniref:SCO6880 family protein n=1 Tax=Nocardioides iriomotensis TaxID=715784 RepID=UPI003B839D39